MNLRGGRSVSSPLPPWLRTDLVNLLQWVHQMWRAHDCDGQNLFELYGRRSSLGFIMPSEASVDGCVRVGRVRVRFCRSGVGRRAKCKTEFAARGSLPRVTCCRFPGYEQNMELSSRTDASQHSLTWGQHAGAHRILLKFSLTPPTTAARLRGHGGHLSRVCR